MQNSPEVLRQRLQETQKKLRGLKENFPDWRAWLSGYGPGNQQPDYVSEILRLEKQEIDLKLELISRGEIEGPEDVALGEAAKVPGASAKGDKREQKEGLDPVSRVPAPITPVGGYGLRPTRKAAMQLPPDPPFELPRDLWPKTVVILGEARKTFALQTQIFEMCLNVIPEMTPLLIAAVQAGKMKAHQALSAMEGILHSLLAFNDDGVKSGFPCLSDRAYRLEQDVRNSDAWLDFATAIAGEIGELNASSAANKGEDRPEQIKAFIIKVSLEAGRQIHKKDISTVAGYSNTTEFQRFQRDDRRTTTIATDLLPEI